MRGALQALAEWKSFADVDGPIRQFENSSMLRGFVFELVGVSQTSRGSLSYAPIQICA